MVWPTIDETRPQGTDKVKDIDNAERDTRTFMLNALAAVTNFTKSGTQPAIRTTVWTTATRPADANLVDRVTGFNTDLGHEEYYDLATTTWKSKVSGMQDLFDANSWIGDIKLFDGLFSGKNPIVGGVAKTNWQICDGTNGTPDFRGKMPLGSGGDYSTGDTGGEITHTLTIDEMPAHTHSYTSSNWLSFHPYGSTSGYTHDTSTLDTSSTGGGQAHNNLPPYYAIAFIKRIS